MKSLHSYSAILDTIFFKMEEESNIVVDFTIGRGRSAGSQSGDFIINSVNGFATEVEFNHHLEFLIAELIRGAHDAVQGLPPGIQPLFFSEVINRIRLLRHVTRFEEFSSVDGKSRGIWIFNDPRFSGENIETVPRYALSQVLHQVSRFALNWKLVICYAEERLKYFHWFYEYFSGKLTLEAKEKEIRRKLPISIPVPRLACFILGCVDCGIIQTESKQELFRITADVCQTPNAPDISPQSFRNHFDFPAPEVIKTTIVDLQRIIQVLRDKLRGIEGEAAILVSWFVISCEWIFDLSDVLDGIM